MKYSWLLITVLFFLSFFSSCKEAQDKNESLATEDEIFFTKEGELAITRNDSIQIANFDIEIAETDYETETGLMYRSSMKANRGMLFIFDKTQQRYFYMKNTTIPLDIIYIKEDKSIATIIQNAQPMNEESLPSQAPVKYVLELNAGTVTKLGIQPDDKIDWSRNNPKE